LNQINEKIPENVTSNLSKPDCSYEVDHVYGFGGDHFKAGLHFGKDNNEIVFTSAALGIV
jgi:hypothetical protein